MTMSREVTQKTNGTTTVTPTVGREIRELEQQMDEASKWIVPILLTKQMDSETGSFR